VPFPSKLTVLTAYESYDLLGMTLDWNYEAGHVTISMPGYVEKALQRFTHPTPTRPQHSPQLDCPRIWSHHPVRSPEDASTPLNKHDITRLQQIIGTFLLFYGRAVLDSTMLVALGT
jgi:hypothetical protein